MSIKPKKDCYENFNEINLRDFVVDTGSGYWVWCLKGKGRYNVLLWAFTLRIPLTMCLMRVIAYSFTREKGLAEPLSVITT